MSKKLTMFGKIAAGGGCLFTILILLFQLAVRIGLPLLLIYVLYLLVTGQLNF